VPDLLVAEGRLGVALGEDPADARAALERCLAELSDPWLVEHPVVVEWYGGQFAPGAPLLDLVSATHTDLHGTTPPVHGAPYGSDLRLLAAAGIPTLHYGPGDVRLAHGPDESVPVQDLLDVTRTLVLLITRFCGTR
jgi:acetylornithine deacetylase